MRLVVAEEAVVIAIGRHKRLKFWWDGWEEVASKGDGGWEGGCGGCRERSSGKREVWSVVREQDGGRGGLM